MPVKWILEAVILRFGEPLFSHVALATPSLAFVGPRVPRILGGDTELPKLNREVLNALIGKGCLGTIGIVCADKLLIDTL